MSKPGWMFGTRVENSFLQAIVLHAFEPDAQGYSFGRMLGVRIRWAGPARSKEQNCGGWPERQRRHTKMHFGGLCDTLFVVLELLDFPFPQAAEIEGVFCHVDTNIVFHVNPFLANAGSLFIMAHATVRVPYMDTTPDQATYGLRAPGWDDLGAAATVLVYTNTVARTISLNNYH